MPSYDERPFTNQPQRPAQRQNLEDMISRSTSNGNGVRNDESWVEISSQPSSSSLSSVAGDVITADSPQIPRLRRRRRMRAVEPTQLGLLERTPSAGGASSQEEYDESESEEDRVMTSSGEGLAIPLNFLHSVQRPPLQSSTSEGSVPQVSDEDENRTAINYPIHNDTCFTPQPNAFSHPSSNPLRNVPESYFAQSSRTTPNRSISRQTPASQQSHAPQNILSPSYNPASQHDEALRASLSTLLSCAAAARRLPRADEQKQRHNTANTARPRTNRMDPASLNLVPESALDPNSPPALHEPTFKPSVRRLSNSSSSSKPHDEGKRKAVTRSKSAEHRAAKKARRSSSTDELVVTPTLLTWAVSAGVVVALTALSFSAGYSMGKEAGRLEASSMGLAGGENAAGCAREATRSGMGLKRAMARTAVQV